MKKLRIYTVIGLMAMFMACSGNGCGGAGSTRPIKSIGQGLDVKEIVKQRGEILPNACYLVPLSEIAQAVGVAEEAIYLTDSSDNTVEKKHSSCFFKWDDDIRGAGVFIQAMRNTVALEYPNFMSKFIESKRIHGEQTVEGTKDFYRPFEGFGDDGSYSYGAGKYFQSPLIKEKVF